MSKIDRFRGDYEFLSNFFPSPISVAGKIYPTVEHAFQAAKTTDEEEMERIRLAPTPGGAKKLGRTVKLRPDWEEIKIGIMRTLVLEKFKKEPLRSCLLDGTRDCHLEEGNTWGDKFWGTCDGEGKNWLGKILMDVRADLRVSPKTAVMEGVIGDVEKDIGPATFVRVTLPDGGVWSADLDCFPLSEKEIKKLKGRWFRLTTTFELVK